MAQLEIDNMEYASDALAQAGYISNATAIISNADLDDEDMADITDWTDADSGTGGTSTQVTFSGKSCMKLLSGNAGSYAARTQDLGTFGTRTVISISIYIEDIGVGQTAGDNLVIQLYNGTSTCRTRLASDGFFVFDGAVFNEVGVNIVVADTWQEWTYDINWTAQTVDIYCDGILQASGVDCSSVNATANGTLSLTQTGTTTANCLSYIDWSKVGSGTSINPNFYFLQSFSENTIKIQGSYSLKGIATTLGLNKTLSKTLSPVSNLSGVNNLKFDIYSSITGSNIKIGIYEGANMRAEITPTIITANTWQRVHWDISVVTDVNKDAIDKIVITIVNADSANTFYIDYLEIAQAIDVVGMVG